MNLQAELNINLSVIVYLELRFCSKHTFLSHLLIAGCDIGVQISVRPFVRSFVRPSVNIYVEVWFSLHK